jgi:hypothetical protein
MVYCSILVMSTSTQIALYRTHSQGSILPLRPTDGGMMAYPHDDCQSVAKDNSPETSGDLHRLHELNRWRPEKRNKVSLGRHLHG